MTKRRVFEVAKELNVSNKEVLDILEKNNIQAKNHLSTIEDGAQEIVQKYLKVNKEQVAVAKISKPAQENRNNIENKQLGKNDIMNKTIAESKTINTNKQQVQAEESKKEAVLPTQNKNVVNSTNMTRSNTRPNTANKQGYQ